MKIYYLKEGELKITKSNHLLGIPLIFILKYHSAFPYLLKTKITMKILHVLKYVLKGRLRYYVYVHYFEGIFDLCTYCLYAHGN